MTKGSQQTVKPLEGHILVLGGNRGLGLEVVKELKNRGLKVTVLCRKSSSELDSVNVEKVVCGADLSKIGDLEPLISKELNGMKFNCIICVAGLLIADEWGSLDYDACRKMYDVCCLGPLKVIETLQQKKNLADGCRIGLITSEGGSTTIRTEQEGGNNYGHHMSKAAENMMGRLLAWDLKPSGYSVVMIHPGFMKTEMTSVYSENYDKFGAIDATEVVPGVLGCIERTSLNNTGRFLSAVPSKNFGMGIMKFNKPEEHIVQYGDVPF